MHRTWFVPIASFLLAAMGLTGAGPDRSARKLLAEPEIEKQTWEPATVSVSRLQRDPLGLAVREFKHAVKMLRKKRYAQSLAFLDRALEIDPDFAEACLNAGVAHLYQGEVEKAAVQFQRAVTLDPRLLLAQSNLALAHLRLGDHPKAEAAARAALDQNPNDLRAHYVLGVSRAAKGLLDGDTRNSLKRASTQYSEALRVLESLSASAAANETN